MKTKLSMVRAGLLVSTHYRDFAMLREGRGEEGREAGSLTTHLPFQERFIKQAGGKPKADVAPVLQD